MLKLNRIYHKDFTTGILTNDTGNLQLFTLELPYLNNERRVSCIKEGQYTIKKHISPSKGLCYHIIDVEDRDNILIHSLNSVRDFIDKNKTHWTCQSRGCVGVGKGFDNEDGLIFRSKEAMQELLEKCNDTEILIIK